MKPRNSRYSCRAAAEVDADWRQRYGCNLATVWRLTGRPHDQCSSRKELEPTYWGVGPPAGCLPRPWCGSGHGVLRVADLDEGVHISQRVHDVRLPAFSLA